MNPNLDSILDVNLPEHDVKYYPKFWYAIYTKSRAEKKVLKELEFQGIETYLPIHKTLRQWSDRKKWVEMPLIPGYIFVHIGLPDYEKVLRTQGVVCYVRCEGKAAIIANDQIDAIKCMLHQHDYQIEVSYKNFSLGDYIEVMSSPLVGLKGYLVTFRGKKRVAVQLSQLNLSLTVDLPLEIIRKVTPC